MKRITRYALIILLALAMTAPSAIPFLGNTAAAQAATISISTKSLTLEAGKTYTLRIYGTSRTPSWTTSKSSVATVSGSGKVTAKSAGTATITATVSGRKYYCTVTVLKLSSSSLTLETGSTSTLKVSGTTQTITWSSSNKAAATVSSSGKITAKAPGTATISAYVRGIKLSCKVTVIPPILISRNSLTLDIGATYKLKVTGTTAAVTWASDSTSVASVSGYGTVTAKAAGSATITALVNGKKLTCKVTVNPPVVINNTVLSLMEGNSYDLKVTGTTDPVTWTSSDNSVAMVSSTGTVTAAAAGTATITASVNGKTLTCALTVTKLVNSNLLNAPFAAKELTGDNYDFVIPKDWTYTADNSTEGISTLDIYPLNSEDSSFITVDIYKTDTSAPDYDTVKEYLNTVSSQDFINYVLQHAYSDYSINVADYTQADYPTRYGLGVKTSYTVSSPNITTPFKQTVIDLYFDQYIVEVTASSVNGFDPAGEGSGIWTADFNMNTVLDYLVKSMVIK